MILNVLDKLSLDYKSKLVGQCVKKAEIGVKKFINSVIVKKFKAKDRFEVKTGTWKHVRIVTFIG